MIKTIEFYGNYYGHKLSHLKTVKDTLKRDYPKHNLIYFAGDSVLDNKHWVLREKRVIPTNGYDQILTEAVPDLAYQVNHLLNEKGLQYFAINTAVEESAIKDKIKALNDQDQFIVKNITYDDILVISIGGNDIALKPDVATIFGIGKILLLNTETSFLDFDHPISGMDIINRIFINGIKNYVEKLTQLTMPKKIIITSLYFMAETGKGWADTPLMLMGYNKNPRLIQALLKRVSYEMEKSLTTSNIQVLPLWQCLDGKIESDYVERVEPSASGGRKMAELIINQIN